MSAPAQANPAAPRSAGAPRAAGALHGPGAVKAGETLRFDVVVVGSGAGGAAVAAELSRAGLEVAVLEEGRSFATDELKVKPSWAYANLYQNRGVIVGSGNVLVPLVAGRAVGGSTFVNSAICFRAPEAVLREWERDFGSSWSPERLLPLFAEIETALEVAKTTPELARKNSLVFKRGADALGLQGDFISRNAPGCVGCGVCQLGCPIGGKGSVDKNLLPSAIENGAHIYSEVKVTRVLVDQGVARGVEAAQVDREGLVQSAFTVLAERVFICAGALGTPQVLQRSGICNGSGQLGENLHVHPGQGSGALFAEEVKYWDGVTQGFFVHMDQAILETFTGTPELFWASLPLGQMSLGKLRNLATVGCMIRDEGKGSVRFQGEGRLPSVKYDLTDLDRQRFIAGARLISRIYFAAGASGVWPLMNTAIELSHTERDALAQLPDDLPLHRLNPYGSHPQGTARLSADPKRGVCKPSGETHEVERLFVADGSLFPNAVGVNPQITIMAMATGIARDLAKAG